MGNISSALPYVGYSLPVDSYPYFEAGGFLNLVRFEPVRPGQYVLAPSWGRAPQPLPISFY